MRQRDRRLDGDAERRLDLDRLGADDGDGLLRHGGCRPDDERLGWFSISGCSIAGAVSAPITD